MMTTESMQSRLSVVGYSAAEFAAVHNDTLRAELIRIVMSRDMYAGIELVSRRAWWSELDGIINDIDVPLLLVEAAMFELQHEIQNYPRILQRFTQIAPERAAYNLLSSFDNCEIERKWFCLCKSIDKIGASLEFKVLAFLMRRDALESGTALAMLTQRASGFSSLTELNEVADFPALLLLLLERLPIRIAISTFTKFVNVESIASSYAGFDTHDERDYVFNGPDNLYECGRVITSRLSSSSAVAWSCVQLLRANMASLKQWNLVYTGMELTGSGHSSIGNQYTYQDNGWLLRVIVPLLIDLIGNYNDDRLRKIIGGWPTFSSLHPAFRLRGIILAMSTAQIERCAEHVVGVADRKGGLPTISDAVARRSKDSDMLARALIRRQMTLYGTITNPDEAAVLHRLIRKGDKTAKEMALATVSHPSFSRLENGYLGFFSQLDWAEDQPELALALILRAVKAGYQIGIIDSKYLVPLVQHALHSNELLVQIIESPELKQIAGYAFAANPDLYALYGLVAFRDGDRYVKSELARTALDQDISVAAKLLSLALVDPDPTIDSDLEKRASETGDTAMISGVRTQAYFTTYQLLCRERLLFYDLLGVELPKVVAQEHGVYGATYGLIALNALYQIAREDKRTSLVADVVMTIEILSERKLGVFVDECLLPFYRAEWHSLSSERKEWFWDRFVATDAVVDAALDAVLRDKDMAGSSCAIFARLAALWSAKQIQRASWRLWTQVVKAAPIVTFDSIVVQWLLDVLEKRAESESYDSLARLYVAVSPQHPTLALNRLICLSITSVETAKPLHVYFDKVNDIQFDLASPTLVLQLGERIGTAGNAGSMWGPLYFLLLLLPHVRIPALAADVARIFQNLKQYPKARDAHSEWISALRR